MDSPADSANPKASGTISKNLPGPPFLRYYPAYQLVAWQPQGTLDDAMLDEIAEWLLVIEKVARPFKRFVDFSRLTAGAGRARPGFLFSRKRRERNRGGAPRRAAVFFFRAGGFVRACVEYQLMDEE